jgi:hypothetical protein
LTLKRVLSLVLPILGYFIVTSEMFIHGSG